MNELSTISNTGLNLYSIILNNGQIWNGTTFVNAVGANWATYAIALSEEDASGLYVGNFPTAIIASGNYSYIVYSKLGGSPVNTDTIIAEGTVVWSGSQETPTPPSNPSDLVTLAVLKQYRGITGTNTDDLLSFLISYVSNYIQNRINLNFSTQEYVEFINTSIGNNRFSTKNHPIQSIQSIKWGFFPGITINYSGSAIFATVETIGGVPMPYGVRIITMTSNGTRTTTNLPFATYPTFSTLVTAINNISGFKAVVQSPYDMDSRYLFPSAAQPCYSYGQKYQVQLAFPNIDMTYSVDYENGEISYQPLSSLNYGFNAESGMLFPTSFQGLMVNYIAGYNVIPLDVQGVAIELIFMAFDRSNTNLNLSSEKIGQYSYTLLDPTQMNDIIDDKLSIYLSGCMFSGGQG